MVEAGDVAITRRYGWRGAAVRVQYATVVTTRQPKERRYRRMWKLYGEDSIFCVSPIF
jgi:hypothetical protein